MRACIFSIIDCSNNSDNKYKTNCYDYNGNHTMSL